LYPPTIITPFTAKWVFPSAVIIRANIVSAFSHRFDFWGLSSRLTFVFPIPIRCPGNSRETDADKEPFHPTVTGLIIFILTFAHIWVVLKL